MSLELRHLKYFAAVGEELHFARAAARVGIEQSPLSQAIRDLEARLGVMLFHRTSCGTSLTRSGALLLPQATRILSLVEKLRRTARDAGSGKFGHLSIGLCTEVFAVRIASVLKQVLEHHPAVAIEIHDEVTHGAQLAALRAGTLDVCFGPVRLDDPDIDSVEVCREPMVAWLPSNHPLAAERSLDQDTLERARARQCRHVTAGTLVASGLGIAIVPSSSVLPSGVAAIVRPIAGRARYSQAWASFRRDDDSVVIKHLIDAARRPQGRTEPLSGSDKMT